MLEKSHAAFPGFVNEIQGVYAESSGGRNRLFTYVIKEGDRATRGSNTM